MSFTAEQAIEASEEGDPIFLSPERVARLIKAHSQDPEEFYRELGPALVDMRIDARTVFLWLGY